MQEVKVGMTAVFDPALDISGNGCDVIKGCLATGVVEYVNQQHRWFQVRFDGQTISFLFSDVGKGKDKKVVLYE